MTIYRAEANKGRERGNWWRWEGEGEANEICKTGQPWRRLNEEEGEQAGSGL